MPYSPLAIANEFIRNASADGKGLEHMKLQKLVHFALGYALKDGYELVNENPQVWRYGPVFPSLYQDLKYHGSEPIKKLEPENYFGSVPEVEDTDKRTKELVAKVWKKYKNYTSFQLSDMTHRPGTPWYDLVVEHKGRVPMGLDIPTEAIKKHYEALPGLE